MHPGSKSMPPNYKMHVWEVQQSAQAILQFTKGKTLHDYGTDWILKSAVERQINKIGGAAPRLIVNDDPNAQRIGSSAGTLGFGNKQDHSWPDFEPQEIWDFIENTLPSLLDSATATLEDEPVDQPPHGKPQRRNIIPLVARRASQIRNLCRRHHVKRLDVFGSAVNGDFRPDESDIDFLVEFDDSVEGRVAPARGGNVRRTKGATTSSFKLKPPTMIPLIAQLNQELEPLFGRSVDLVVDSAIQNPYFRDEVDQTREPIYDA